MTTLIEPPDRVLGSADAPTFASLGVDPALVKALADAGHHHRLPHPGHDGRRRPRRARRLRQGEDRLGQDPRLRHPAAPAHHGLARSTRARAARGRLVLVPTRELAVQVYDVLEPLAKEAGLRIAAVYGGADIERQVKKMRRGVDVVIATPGRLIDLGDRGELSVADIETLVLDEADRMADMGFMPQVEWVLRRARADRTRRCCSPPPSTARWTGWCSRYLTDPVLHEVASPSTTVDAMEHRFLEVHQMDKVKVCAAICRNSDKALVFVRTKRGADRLVEQLAKRASEPPPSTATFASPTASAPSRDFSRGQAARARGHRRGRPRPRHRHGRRGDPLRPARGPQGLPAPLGPDRPGRRGRRGGHPACCGTRSSRSSASRPASGCRLPIVEIFSNDPRLADLAAWPTRRPTDLLRPMPESRSPCADEGRSRSSRTIDRGSWW